MSIEYRSTFDAEKLKKEILEKRERALRITLEQEVGEIQKRTGQGIDADGRGFVKYSPAYGRAKAFATGRTTPDLIGFRYKRQDGQASRAKSGGTGGEMLRSMTSKVEKVANGLIGIIYFNGALQAAKAHGNMRYRKFFALSKDQIKRFIDAMRNP